MSLPAQQPSGGEDPNGAERAPEQRHTADRDLARLAHSGDAEAIRVLGRRLGCIGRLVDRELGRGASSALRAERDDLVQDTLMLLWQKLETYEGRATLESWAWSYVRNLVRNRVRRVWRDRGRSEFDETAWIPQMSDKPEISGEEVASVEAGLARLPDDAAKVIRLKHYDGLTFRQIADRFEVPENTAKTRYYRALRRLRETLRGTPAEEQA